MRNIIRIEEKLTSGQERLSPPLRVRVASVMFLASAVCAGQASAGSIDPITSGMNISNSVVTIECPKCPALVKREKVSGYVVQDLEPGTQKVETREINGVMKVVRTEAWLGGSPIVFISKVPGADAIATASEEMTPATDELAISNDDTPPPIDNLTTTSAVTATMDGPSSGEDKMNAAQNKLLNPDSFKLRAN